jgi:hypothetical protein
MAKDSLPARPAQVIQQVGLAHARKTIVGDPLRRGLSGGERKRLCVAVELLTQVGRGGGGGGALPAGEEPLLCCPACHCCPG